MPLTAKETKDLLSKKLLAYLGVVEENVPHVTPIWVTYEKGAFYFTTRLNRVKGRSMRKNPHVSICIATDKEPYKAIIAEGKVKPVEEGKWDILKRIGKKYSGASGVRWVQHVRKQPDRAVFMLKPTLLLTWHYGRGDSQRQDEGVSMRTELP